jgi:hypothetical protein
MSCDPAEHANQSFPQLAWGRVRLAPTEDMSGAAASPTIRGYRPNSGEVADRSLPSLLAWASSKGVGLPGYMEIIPVPPDVELRRADGTVVPAKYCDFRFLAPGTRIYWHN